MSGVRVRVATVEDAAGIARVRVRGWQTAYRGVISDAFLDALDINVDTERVIARLGENESKGVLLQVADYDSEVVGFVSSGPPRDDDCDASTWEIYAIYTDPERKRRGIGRVLLGAAVGTVPGDVADIVLWAFCGNDDARLFYESLGFVDDGTRKLDRLDAAADRGKAEEMRFRAPVGALRERLGLK